MPTYFAPAKLNLFLHVTGRRADGYHTLQSLFTLIDFGDEIEIDVTEGGDITRRNDVPGVLPSADLTIRAALALQAASGSKHGAAIKVVKRVPMGAGLGGGSSDAATVLLALNQLWQLDWPREKLASLGLTLGADVPFFVNAVKSGSALAEGVGEVLTPVALPRWWYVVVAPSVHVPTPFVFGQPDLTRNTPAVKIADFSAAVLAGLKNDLQAVVLKGFPEVAARLAELSAVSTKSLFGARMTGSGACVFAAFANESDAKDAFQQLPPGITGFVARGLDLHPNFG
jgi:4-diphosphocytidyl-2-C-methyl-D-erythritol kinase